MAKVKVIVVIEDEKTGKVIEAKSTFPGTVPNAEDFDCSTRDGLMGPLDVLEGALLQTSYASMRIASEEMIKEGTSQKKTEPSDKVRIVEVDSLYGRFPVPVTGELYLTLNSRERLNTYSLLKLMVQMNASSSYRINVNNLNEVLHRGPDDKIAVKTEQELMIRLGNAADKKIDSIVDETLRDNGFDPESDTFLPPNPDDLPSEIKTGCTATLSTDDPILMEKINEYNKGKTEDRQISLDRLEEHLVGTEASIEYTVNISIDDVCHHAQKTVHIKKDKSVSNANSDEKVPKTDQNPENLEHFYAEYTEASESESLEEEAKEAEEADKQAENGQDNKKTKAKSKGKRNGKKKKKNGSKKRSRVWHTTGQVIDGKTGKTYRFHGQGKKNVLKQILAFLLNNDLLRNRNLVFNTDGAEDIRLCIEQCFSFHPHKIILDWHHVVKKTSQYVSLAFGGSIEDKRKIRKQIFSYLWVGEVDKAIAYLGTIDTNMIKNKERFDDLTGYLERKKLYMPCYALRHILGLKNSSQFVEKTNDLVVSSRQKHNGMSWSWCGSNSIATLRTLELNGELDSFFRTGTISFTLIDFSKKQKPSSGQFVA